MIRTIHRTTALVLGLYVVVHIGNHLTALAGPGTHIAVMDILRRFYRWPPVELLLYISVYAQILTGVTLAWRGRHNLSDWKARAQVITGLCVALFLLQHTNAVLYARHFMNLDTNFYFAASVIVTKPHAYYFMPYYTVGVIGIFAHVGIGLSYRFGHSPGGRVVALGVGLLGPICALLILVALSGLVHPFTLPQEFRLD